LKRGIEPETSGEDCSKKKVGFKFLDEGEIERPSKELWRLIQSRVEGLPEGKEKIFGSLWRGNEGRPRKGESQNGQ